MIFLGIITGKEKRFIEDTYSKYKKLLFSTAAKYAVRAEEVDDIVQEAVLNIIKHASVLEKFDEKRLTSYLFVTVRNTAYTHLKKEEKESWEYIDESIAAVKDFLDIENYIIIKEQIKTVKQIIENMSEREQAILYGRYYLEMSFDELAEVIGCKPASVRMMLTRAKRELLEKLRKEENCNG